MSALLAGSGGRLSVFALIPSVSVFMLPARLRTYSNICATSCVICPKAFGITNPMVSTPISVKVTYFHFLACGTEDGGVFMWLGYRFHHTRNAIWCFDILYYAIAVFSTKELKRPEAPTIQETSCQRNRSILTNGK
jgi:hypothetical protein